jgi:hypothetical protein
MRTTPLRFRRYAKDGPWMTEPDRTEWQPHGFPCLIKRGELGQLCGYVGLPPGHPWYDLAMETIDCEVHGGLTYAQTCSGDICHVPPEGEPDHRYWLGFDCAHGGDLVPASTAWPIELQSCWVEVYRDMPYVVKETESLAAQCQAAAC